jgi:3',5'-cyclic AMP phosphodiesterase CpdA
MPTPARPAEPVVIAHLSDLHLGAHSPRAAEAVVADVAAARPSVTVVTGDLTMRARTAQFRQARAMLDRLPRPLLVVPGNHDIPLDSAVRFTDPYGRYRRWIDAELDPLVRIPGLTALGLQSTPWWRWKSGRVTAGQIRSVETLLGPASRDGIRLLALHHPLSVPGPAGVIGRAGLVRALAGARVDLVLAGHTHVPASGALTPAGAAHRVVEVVAGTAVSRRVRGAGRSWTVIRVEDSALVVQERQEQDSGWDVRRTTSYPWVS